MFPVKEGNPIKTNSIFTFLHSSGFRIYKCFSFGHIRKNVLPGVTRLYIFFSIASSYSLVFIRLTNLWRIISSTILRGSITVVKSTTVRESAAEIPGINVFFKMF